jgi:hypothetical protein
MPLRHRQRRRPSHRQTGARTTLAELQGVDDRADAGIGENAVLRGFSMLHWLRTAWAVGALRLAGRSDIAEATHWATRDMQRPFIVLGLVA